jgi:hypothetical protein
LLYPWIEVRFQRFVIPWRSIMKKALGWVMVTLVGALTVGCNSSREIEVTGEVTAASGTPISGKILVDFRDVLGEDDAPKSVTTTTLDGPGAFTHKGEFEGDEILVRAVNDKDGNGACSAGEPWAEAKAPIGDDDKVAPVKLALVNTDCPAER